MKKLLTWTILALATFGCANKQTPQDETLALSKTPEKKDYTFRQIDDFPTIKDTTQFIADLLHVFELEVDESPLQKTNEKISSYKKVKIYGSDSAYFFIEYDYGSGSGASFPWKYQILLTSQGALVKVLSCQRYDFVEIFENENPFLLTVLKTSKGNGGHQLYKILADTLENVYEGYYDYEVQTVDAHEDNSIYEPNELMLNVKDFNNDGYNDISFSGKMVFLQGQTKNGDWFSSETRNGKEVIYSIDNPYKKIPVEFVYHYDKQTGHFKAKENYSEKYCLEN